MKSTHLIPRINNFDLIRLIAAFQVMYVHCINYMQIIGPAHTIYIKFIKYFHGVPIFFTVSGFLIFWAFDRNKNLKKYSLNRFLRLFPALYVCVLICALLLLFFSPTSIIGDSRFYLWIIGQASFFQFYTPDILRFWGIGTPNGPLWTISVEIQFYILVPIIFLLLNKIKAKILLPLLLILSVALNFILAPLSETIPNKLFFISIIPFLYNFLIGSIFYLFWDKLKNIILDKFVFWTSVYIAYFSFFGNYLNYELYLYRMDSIFHFITALLLAITALSFAFSYKNLSDKLLKGNDISYGIYIYHMLIVNILIELGYINSQSYLILTILGTLILATLSWKFIEKPALNLKRKF